MRSSRRERNFIIRDHEPALCAEFSSRDRDILSGMGPDAEVLSFSQFTGETGVLIPQAARTRRRQAFRQSRAASQGEIGSCNIAAAKVGLQGLGRDRRSGQLEGPSPERR